jgi:hypothetical protein
MLFTRFGGVTRASLPLDYDKTYLLVGKVCASAKRPDQVFIRVYGPDETVDRRPPRVWSLASPPYDSDMVIDGVTLHVNSRQTVVQFDEFRVGTTWSAVVGPWVE